MPQDDDGAAVPTGRAARLLRFGGIVTGIAGSVAAGCLRALASVERPDMAQLLLTPANTFRLPDGFPIRTNTAPLHPPTNATIG
ncbi:hypothetical protein [Aquibium sp. ELW1220]|uniref:hypothetical protein n=1 Tax=Aquibium sp. ELW1220 TaxID=2976766 RepID=UPI0025B25411|nr:hypothetical protein [Aquibium sp. ELW1220]MDN2584203.1 hypothetical protein [Aquibium sp. ELW1220]